MLSARRDARATGGGLASVGTDGLGWRARAGAEPGHGWVRVGDFAAPGPTSGDLGASWRQGPDAGALTLGAGLIHRLDAFAGQRPTACEQRQELQGRVFRGCSVGAYVAVTTVAGRDDSVCVPSVAVVCVLYLPILARVVVQHVILWRAREPAHKMGDGGLWRCAVAASVNGVGRGCRPYALVAVTSRCVYCLYHALVSVVVNCCRHACGMAARIKH